MKAKPKTPKPGWVVVGPDGQPRWHMARETRSQAIIRAEQREWETWDRLRRLGYRVRRCQVTE